MSIIIEKIPFSMLERANSSDVQTMLLKCWRKEKTYLAEYLTAIQDSLIVFSDRKNSSLPPMLYKGKKSLARLLMGEEWAPVIKDKNEVRLTEAYDEAIFHNEPAFDYVSVKYISPIWGKFHARYQRLVLPWKNKKGFKFIITHSNLLEFCYSHSLANLENANESNLLTNNLLLHEEGIYPTE